MLILEKEKNERPIGLMLRVVAKSTLGCKHIFLPHEILNKHWEVADLHGKCAYSTNVPFNLEKWGKIEKVFFFANSKGETWLCSCTVEKIMMKENEWIPNIDEKYLVSEWKDEPKKNWLILKNFEQIEINDCKYKCLNKDMLIKEQILAPRFRSCYVDIENDI